jgi:hypothetical protein
MQYCSLSQEERTTFGPVEVEMNQPAEGHQGESHAQEDHREGGAQLGKPAGTEAHG